MDTPEDDGNPGGVGSPGTRAGVGGTGGTGGTGGRGTPGAAGAAGAAGGRGPKGDPGAPGHDAPSRSTRERFIWSLPYIGLVLALALTLYTSNVQQSDLAKETRARLSNEEQANIDSNFRICNSNNQVRVVIRDLVSSSGVGLDLTAIPSFKNLDVAEQQYFRDLTDLLKSNASSETRQQELLAKVPLRDCESEFPNHS